MKNIKFIDKKIIVSGNVIEVYDYEKPITKGYTSKHNAGRHNIALEEDKQENRGKVLHRAKVKLRRLINANSFELNKFITLTFKENETDLDYCNYEFKKFIQRLKYYVKNNESIDALVLKYVVVVEFQKRGAVHYHLLCNLPYIKNSTLREIWGNGFVKINRIDRVDNVGSYVVKYMDKDFDDPRLSERKCYFTSRNLRKPIEYENEADEVVTQLLQSIDPIYSSSFDNDYIGKVEYKQYNINRMKG